MGNIQGEQIIQDKDPASSIISFATSYELKKKPQQRNKQNKQRPDNIASISLVSESLDLIWLQIEYNCQQIIKIPNLLQSLIQLCRYNINIHINKEQDEHQHRIRKKCRSCLGEIQYFGDEKAQAELINVGYGRVLIISVSTAGGTEEQYDNGIFDGLICINRFLRDLHQGRNNYNAPKFPSQSDLFKTCIEQMEERGGIEEIDSQIFNKGDNRNIQSRTNSAKEYLFNFYIYRRNI